MKISIVGAGNVGGLTAMRLAQEGIGDIHLIDIAKGLAQGKALDMEDARPLVKINYNIHGSDDLTQIKDSDIVVVTAGFPRKPGMTREDLLQKNAAVLKEVCLQAKLLAAGSILIIVTNPLDPMTHFALKITGFKPNRVIGMGISLDAARFANLIANELKVLPLDVDACVIGSHGEGMLPLARFTRIKGVALGEFLKDEQISALIKRTIERGKEIVTLLGSGSAYFAPSAAITAMVKAIVKDELRTLGACAYLNGEYGFKDVCLGVPCRLGKEGIEEIIELDLNAKEKQALLDTVASLKEQAITLAP